MNPVKRMRRMARLTLNYVYAGLFPQAWKHKWELNFWNKRRAEGPFTNSHFEQLYTEVYGLTRKDFEGKRILDIGCGPRGSLEWAGMAAQRVGIDPLVRQYLKLGADQHKMEYITARSERIPFPDAHFDFVCSLNSLDHVDDFDATVREIKRVTKPGGFFLLSVEMDHPPTAEEPITITDNSLQQFAPEFAIVTQFRVGTPPAHNLHVAVVKRSPPYVSGRPGVFVARYVRR
jgi:SAM-dependent methyltransferase